MARRILGEVAKHRANRGCDDRADSGRWWSNPGGGWSEIGPIVAIEDPGSTTDIGLFAVDFGSNVSSSGTLWADPDPMLTNVIASPMEAARHAEFLAPRMAER